MEDVTPPGPSGPLSAGNTSSTQKVFAWRWATLRSSLDYSA